MDAKGRMSSIHSNPGAVNVLPQLILVAGPYRFGTGDDPALIARNVAAMTDASLRLFRLGHLPVMGGVDGDR